MRRLGALLPAVLAAAGLLAALAAADRSSRPAPATAGALPPTGPTGSDRAMTLPGPAGEDSAGLDWGLPAPGDPQAARAVQALARAYPGRIREAAWRDGDWAVRIDEVWFYWAEGRLLPRELRGQWVNYAPYRFYRYPAELPQVPQVDERMRERLAERIARNEASPPQRCEDLLCALYQARSLAETEARIVEAKFLGRRVRVHRMVAAPLQEVGRELERLAEEDPQVRAFLESLRSLAGWNWRPIDGTRSRSYHGYGAAVDLVPRSYGGKQVYWRWTMQNTPDWYAVPYARRWMVPEAVVRAFEARGFVWGGKWLFFDTMHFEYRPELLLFSAPD